MGRVTAASSARFPGKEGIVLLKLDSLLAKLERMLLIRRFEEGMLRLHSRRVMPVHFHISIGQEAAVVGVCSALREQDVVYSNHRSNGHLIARGAQLDWMFAEQLGRAGGNTSGKGGTLHMIAPDLGIPWTTSLVGSSIPMAVGTALAMKQQRRAGIVVAFFGDGVLEEGAFYEGINLAALWQVPLLFICENNAVPAELRSSDTTSSSTFRAGRLSDVPAAFGLPCAATDGADVPGVFRLMEKVVDTVRRTGTPYFVEVRTTRYPGNQTFWPHLPGAETDVRWAWGEGQPPEELAHWTRSSDPVMRFIQTLLADGVSSREEVSHIDGTVRAEVEGAMDFAIRSPQPSLEEAYRQVWAEDLQ